MLSPGGMDTVVLSVRYQYQSHGTRNINIERDGQTRTQGGYSEQLQYLIKI